MKVIKKPETKRYIIKEWVKLDFQKEYPNCKVKGNPLAVLHAAYALKKDDKKYLIAVNSETEKELLDFCIKNNWNYQIVNKK